MDKATNVPLTETVYTSKSRPRGFAWSGFSPRAYIDLLLALTSAQVKVRYRYTLIGVGWAVVNPVVMMFVYAFVFGSIFGADRANYKMFLLAGLLPWQAFAGAVNASTRSVIVEKDLLKKAPFPSELLPTAAVLNAMFNFSVVFVVFVFYLLVTGHPVFAAFHWVVLALVIQTVLSLGIALFISCVNVFFRDVEQLVGFGVWMWFFMTPIVYPIDKLPAEQGKWLSLLNPMAAIVSTIRNALLKGNPPPVDPLIAATLAAAIALTLGWIFFRRFQYELPKAL